VSDLAARRAMSERWAQETFGLMGRTHRSCRGISWLAMPQASVFAEAGKQFADNVMRYHASARDNHLYLSYAIVPPQIDRSKPAHKQSDPRSMPAWWRSATMAIVLKGAQQLGTGAVFFRRHLYKLHPSLAPAMKPMPSRRRCRATRRVEDLSPPPLCAGATSSFDYPLSSRFDEIDSLIRAG